MSPTEAIRSTGADHIAILEALRAAGWIIVRHDAIKLAQAHARDDLDGAVVIAPSGQTHKNFTIVRSAA